MTFTSIIPSHHRRAGRSRAVLPAVATVLALIVAPAALHQVWPQTAAAQTAPPVNPPVDPPAWDAGVEIKKPAPPVAVPSAPGKPNTTVIERAGDANKTATGNGSGGPIRLIALLTADGQQIDQGIVWRIYQAPTEPDAKAKLISEHRDASPLLKLAPGDYTVNASFGRAHITRKVSVKAGQAATEQFVLNAGGLRLTALLGGKPAPAGSVTYSIFSDDRDQFANRTAVMSGAKPNLIMRLNAGIYRLVSTYGDANARVETDVTVEAGKLTEATVAHAAGKATFHLVTREGGEALPDTQWSVVARSGDVVKESVGALPTHTLAPGSYTVVAKWSGEIYKRDFAVKDGETVTVEVLKVGGAAAPGADPAAITPSLEIKSP